MAEKTPKPDQATWLEMVQRFERAIGEPIEALVRSDSFFDLITQANRARSRLNRTFDDAWEQWLHLFNIPAATDIRRLKEQLGRVERQLNQLAKDLADREEAEQESRRPAATPTRRSTRKRTAQPPGGARAGAEPEADAE